MTDRTNPRKIIQVGNNLGITIPNGRVKEWGIEQGDRYVLEPTTSGFRAIRVEWQTTDQ